jgi:hypothetical protein
MQYNLAFKGSRRLCNIENHCLCILRQSTGILNTTKQDVSETGSVSVLRQGEGDIYCVSSLRRR